MTTAGSGCSLGPTVHHVRRSRPRAVGW